MFKKTLVAAALASAAMSVSAYQIGTNNDFNVEVYGVAAISAVNYNVAGNEDTGPTGNAAKHSQTTIENESRIGFRAGKDMTDSINVFMQVESGYVDNVDWGHGGTAGGVLGFRDTFIGLKGDWGKVRFGRVLTPMYEIVDWPFSNPGLGIVFDWGGDVVANYDRQSNQIRYDSPAFGGFTFAASVGTDDNAAWAGSETGNEDSIFFGANARYSISVVNLMAGFETGSDFGGVAGVDNTAYIVGAEVALPAGFGFAAAYKGAELDNNGKVHSQSSYSAILQYWNGPLGVKAGYAANLDSELDGKTQDDADSVASVQVMGVINGFVPYVRIAQRNLNNPAQGWTNYTDGDIVTRVGIEYGF